MFRAARDVITRPLAFATGVASLATLIAYGGRWFWICELLVNFRTHYALFFVAALPVALVIGRWSIAAAAMIGLALNVWPMVGTYFGVGVPVPPNARAVRLAAFNINIGNENLPAIAAWLDATQADVAVLAEVSPPHAEKLAALVPRLSSHYFAEHDGVWGVVILSRWPLRAPQPATNDGVTFAARVDVDLGDRIFRLYGAHLNWPVVPETEAVRNAQLAAMGRELSGCEHACVAVGDFNVTPWSSHFRDTRDSRGVHDCTAGRGFLATWSSDLPAPLRIRIDQCLVAGAVGVADVRVGDSVASDHFATINDLMIGGS
ncbi:MAG TPA: endonuclease/exonuclease/phosphatase family protein [Steroidobacteraceae bacterium]|nr:endonuclease/exonuclease/phosphatase family protein [Steroidobacteraceae bacterium]